MADAGEQVKTSKQVHSRSANRKVSRCHRIFRSQNKRTTRAQTPRGKIELKKLSRFVVINEKQVRKPRKTFAFTEIEENDRDFKNERKTQYDVGRQKVQTVSILGCRKGLLG